MITCDVGGRVGMGRRIHTWQTTPGVATKRIVGGDAGNSQTRLLVVANGEHAPMNGE